MSKIINEYKSIGIVRECESAENPGGLEKRVALIPSDVGRLTAYGIEVFVEHGAGKGVNFSDQDYIDNGAIMQGADEIYLNKELIVKFKGPSAESIKQMTPGCTLMCMAHLHSFPERKEKLNQQKINVVAMEGIIESPKVIDDSELLGQLAMQVALSSASQHCPIEQLDIFIIGYDKQLAKALQFAARQSPNSLSVLSSHIDIEKINQINENTLFFYNSPMLVADTQLREKIRLAGGQYFDIAHFIESSGSAGIAAYHDTHQQEEFGGRRIQCLNEAGRAAAKYGLALLKENKPQLDIRQAKIVVLGYGNVASGAMQELKSNEIHSFAVLGAAQTKNTRIEAWLQDADLIINGAELAKELRGKQYLVTNEHLKTTIRDGSVLIDIVGGSKTNPSAIEAVKTCTFLSAPHFVQDGITIAALFGWPMMGMMRESNLAYSQQITDVLIGQDQLIQGIDNLTAGVKPALVVGPY